MGKIFGHSFESILIKKGFVVPYGFKVRANGEDALKLIELTRGVYLVSCKRCGYTPEQEKKNE